MNTHRAVARFLAKEEKTELKSERVELGIIDDLKKDIQNAKNELKGAENLHKAAEKDNDVLNKYIGEKADIETKLNKASKERNSTVKFAKETIKDTKALLTKSKKTAQSIKKQIEDLGLSQKVIAPELKEIENIEQKLKSLNFGFLDDLPF
tara:strand:- start:69 stop:521 length:453 start_codon:yes stop_codon:yes gene_type:complete